MGGVGVSISHERVRGVGVGDWVGGWDSFNWVENPICPFHFFKILIPYSRFSRIDKTDVKDCSAHAFPYFPFFNL